MSKPKGGRKLPPGAIGWTSDGRPVIPKQGESPDHARKRVEAHKHK